MEGNIPGLKRRSSIVVEAVAAGGGGGAAYRDRVAASAISSRKRCICDCKLPADAVIPLEVVVDKLQLKRFLYKLLSNDKEKCEMLLVEFEGDAKAAQDTYRIASYHLDGGARGIAPAAAAGGGPPVFMVGSQTSGRQLEALAAPRPWTGGCQGCSLCLP